MTDSGQNKRLALAVRSLAKLRLDYAEVRADFKARIEALVNDVDTLSQDIVSGQERLKLETPDGTPDQPNEGEN